MQTNTGLQLQGLQAESRSNLEKNATGQILKKMPFQPSVSDSCRKLDLEAFSEGFVAVCKALQSDSRRKKPENTVVNAGMPIKASSTALQN